MFLLETPQHSALSHRNSCGQAVAGCCSHHSVSTGCSSPVTSTPSCSSKQLLLSRAAMVVLLTPCQADTSCVTHRHSPSGISPSTVWGRQAQTAAPSLPLPEQSHCTHNYAACGSFGTQAHTSPAQRANSPAPLLCPALPAAKSSLKAFSSLNTQVPTAPVAPGWVSGGFWCLIGISSHK